MRLRWIVLPSCLLCACAAPVEPANDIDTPEPDPPVVALDPYLSPELAASLPEHISEAEEPLSSSACSTICWAVQSLGCAVVVGACAEATAVTLGGAVIPCEGAFNAACIAGLAGVAACMKWVC